MTYRRGRVTAGAESQLTMPQWRVGTIGFGYSDWEKVFYPDTIKSADHLAFYARHFDTIELDTTFHAAPTPERVSRWAAAVPDGFRFCVKTPKDVTHAAGPLSGRAAAMAGFLDAVRGFGAKLGVVLVQFPPGFDTSQARELEKLLSGLPRDLRYAVELRHPSWRAGDSTKTLLIDHGCAWVAADYFDDPWEITVTADFLYVRWIGEHGRFPTLDRERVDVTERLAWWTRRIEESAAKVNTVWGLVNNDYSGYAVATANRVKGLVGLPVKESDDPSQGELF